MYKKTVPVEDIIPRNLEPDLEKLLIQLSSGIEELVNFGSNLIKWDIEKSTMDNVDLPPILFFRNFIEQIDAISILIKSSSVEPCKNILRTALENMLYLEYLLDKDFYNRSMSFLVWNYINNNKNLERLNASSEEYKKIEKVFFNDKIMKNQIPPILTNVDELLNTGNLIINSTKFQPFKIEYEATQKRLKKNNISWYSLFNGPRNIKELAENLKNTVLYDGFFKNYSSATHGTDILQGKLTSSTQKDFGIIQIRDPQNAQHITQNCFNFCLIIFPIYIQKRIPIKQTDFNNWYLGIIEFHRQITEKQLIEIKKR
ncbi:MAG: hypothetical protein A2X08_03610 [Bacteroidetes bacterium GWA2_32_17]|nr:MAG: hypothetical protein A2X08_03610 [Bacteroidetes bacterium GWA2_32_17]